MGACCETIRGSLKDGNELVLNICSPLKMLKTPAKHQALNLLKIKSTHNTSNTSLENESSPLEFHPLYLVRELKEDFIESLYEMIKLIGKGTYGAVHLVKNKMTGKLCVLKTLKKTPEIDPNTVNFEAQILKKLVSSCMLKNRIIQTSQDFMKYFKGRVLFALWKSIAAEEI